MKTPKRVLVCVLTYLMFHSLCAFAQSSIKVSYHEVPGRMEYDYTGPLLDTIVLAFKEVGYDVEFTQMPQERHARSLVDTSADCAFLFPPYAAMFSEVYFTQPVAIFENVVVGLEEEPADISALSTVSIAGFPEARVLLGDEFNSVIKGNPNYIELNGRGREMMMLVSRRTKYILSDKRVLDLWFKKNMPDTKVYVKYAFTPLVTSGACTQKIHTEAFDSGLNKLIDSGKLDEIYQRYD